MNNNKNYNIYDILYLSDEEDKKEEKKEDKKPNTTKKLIIKCLDKEFKEICRKSLKYKVKKYNDILNNKKYINIINNNNILLTDYKNYGKKTKYDRELYYNHKRISQDYLSPKKPVHFT